jgi:hypothetical protein
MRATRCKETQGDAYNLTTLTYVPRTDLEILLASPRISLRESPCFQNDAGEEDIINDGGVSGGGEGVGGGSDTCPGGRSEGGKQPFKMVK